MKIETITQDTLKAELRLGIEQSNEFTREEREFLAENLDDLQGQMRKRGYTPEEQSRTFDALAKILGGAQMVATVSPEAIDKLQQGGTLEDVVATQVKIEMEGSSYTVGEIQRIKKEAEELKRQQELENSHLLVISPDSALSADEIKNQAQSYAQTEAKRAGIENSNAFRM